MLSGVYKRIWRFFGLRDAAAIGHSVTLVFLISILWRVLDPGVFADTPVPFGVLVIHPFLAMRALVGVRMIRLVVYNRAGSKKQGDAVAGSASACCWRAPVKRDSTCCMS